MTDSLPRSARFLPVLALSACALCAPLSAQSAPTPSAAPHPGGPPPRELPVQRPELRTYTFQLVLLVADNEGKPGLENVPPRAEKALTDVRDFLPYKSYRLLDLGWLRSSGDAEVQLAGPDGEALSAGIRFRVPPGGGDQLEVLRFVIVRTNPRPTLLEAPRRDGAPSAVAPPANRPLLETSFGMRSGETVVVGTAKLDGPAKALVVVLSAVP